MTILMIYSIDMDTLNIDIETYATVDLTKTGVYRYVEDKQFEILLFAYAFNKDPVQLIDFTKEQLPKELIIALTDPKIIKSAFNANFERVCLSKHTGISLSIEQWECTAVHSLMAGLPGSLKRAAEVLNISNQKISGSLLINYFSKPCKPTIKNNGRTRNRPADNPEKWEQFCKYCKQDVEVEREIKKTIQYFKIPEFEKDLWVLDQRINDRGISIDTELVDHAIQCSAEETQRLFCQAKELTGIENPNSPAQLKKWIEHQTGKKVESLNKEAVEEMLNGEIDTTVKELLQLRVKMAKTSVKKYIAIKNAFCKDNTVKGILQYYGANRTGRWAGRNVQIHNLPHNKIKDLDLARETLKNGDYEGLDILYGNTANILSQLIRTALIPTEGNHFIVADFSAIEARVIAWLANETWRLDVFRSHGKIYEASASQMFGVPIAEITKGNPLRQKGKIAELALGYGGSIGALVSMGALKMGLSENELPPLVSLWRSTNMKIVQLWEQIERAAKMAIQNKNSYKIQQNVKFTYENNNLYIQLPSERKLVYLHPEVSKNGKWNKDCILYEGINQQTNKWGKIETYGAKLTENIVQAIARDCLAEGLMALDKAGYSIVAHVHDEVIIDAPKYKNATDVVEILCQPILWAPGLPLRAEGFETLYYKKD